MALYRLQTVVKLRVAYAECQKKPYILVVVMLNVIMLSVAASKLSHISLSNFLKKFVEMAEFECLGNLS